MGFDTNMARKLTRKSLITKLDKLTSKIVIRLCDHCVTCGSTTNLTNSHLFSRRNLATRWDIDKAGNCHTQCWPCNFKHTARDSQPYTNWYIKMFGHKKWEELHIRWAQVTKIKRFQLEILKDEFETILKND